MRVSKKLEWEGKGACGKEGLPENIRPYEPVTS
jgi:hypothetical protein